MTARALDAPEAYERLAGVYDRWLSGDDAAAPCLAFYRRALRGEDGPVIELGCGTGRIAVALAVDDHDVLGVDASPAMLAQARARAARMARPPAGALHFAAGTFARLPAASGAFGAALLPMRTLGHLLDDDAARACFAEVARVLRPGGRFLLDHYRLDRAWAEAHDGVEQLMYAGREPGAHRALLIWDRYDYAFAQRALRCTVRIETIGSAAGERASERVEFAFRWFEAEEVVALAEAAGLALEGRWGSFDMAPLDAESEQLVLAFRKPETAA